MAVPEHLSTSKPQREQWIVLRGSQFIGPFESQQAAERWCFYNGRGGVFPLVRQSQVVTCGACVQAERLGGPLVRCAVHIDDPLLPQQ